MHLRKTQNWVVYSSEINDDNVNVTSKGIINGLSVLPNDGTGGFGPDTTLGATSVGEIGSPYTQTVGIMEAVDYAYSISIPFTDDLASLITNIAPSIKIGIGTFTVNAVITIPYNLSIDIIGSGMGSTILDSTGISGNIIYWNKSTAAAPINGGNYYTYGNKMSDFTLFTDNTSTSEYAIDLSQPEGAYRYTVERITINDTSPTALSLKMDGLEGSILENVIAQKLSFLNPYGGLQLYHCVFPYISVASTNAVYLNCTIYYQITVNDIGSGLLSVHSFIGGYIGTSNETSEGNLVFNNPVNAAAFTINITGAYWFFGGGSTYPQRPMISGSSSVEIWVNILGLATPNLGYSNWNVFASTFTNVVHAEIIGSMPNSSDILNNSSQPTTPSVPTSATAQVNNHSYPVNVYLYGGTVTKIQITKGNGTAYTVFSNSTGLALSGQSYKLNPLDYITITYTTAPDWTWLSD